MALENGVAHKLARHRAATLTDVSYRLRFVVPAEKTEPVAFVDTISFCYHPKASEENFGFQIDFQGSLCPDKPLMLNGKRLKDKDFVYNKEHLLILTHKLKRGKNTIVIEGKSLDDKLNRQADYLYTLFVPAGARSAFPCFDQPDLKAKFHLSLTLPDGWKSVSSDQGDAYPIPTYLFSFAAGRFEEYVAERDGRRLRALYRETDPEKVAQLPQIMDEAALSVRWMEEYTGIPYPFRKNEMVILPGFQFGGMEHPGAIQYKARTMFLPKGATIDEQLNRLKLIAHETAHMWFGDLVTMRWFDDVWTKEVYANFMADKISNEVHPEIDPSLNFLKTYYLPALSTDRTLGTHPIQQPLANLNAAGLLYGNIIYNKAPLMMQKLEQQMGDDKLRRGLQVYLRKYSYANATWDDLIHVLDSVAPEARLPQFSHVWVKEKGLPTIALKALGDSLEIRQHDPWGRELVWPQTFLIHVGYGTGVDAQLTFQTEKAVERVPLPLPNPNFVVPSPDGSGYGRFVLTTADADSLMRCVARSFADEEATYRLSALSMLYEQWLMHRMDTRRLAQLMLGRLEMETNSIVFNQTISYLSGLMRELEADERAAIERRLFALAMDHDSEDHAASLSADRRQQLKRSFLASFATPELIDSVYAIWQRHDDAQLTERHYTAIAYAQAIHRPQQWRQILDTQRQRLKNVDDQREFDFVSRACTPSADERWQLFESLLQVDNRRVEPWARDLLALLCHRSRGAEIKRYLVPGLDAVTEIQQTGGIFFPNNWLQALLANQRPEEARETMKAWIRDNEADLLPALMNKVKERAFYLLNE